MISCRLLNQRSIRLLNCTDEFVNSKLARLSSMLVAPSVFCHCSLPNIAHHLRKLSELTSYKLPFPIPCWQLSKNNICKTLIFISDLLANTFGAIGHFDTVVALHILEHLTEADMYSALMNLLKVRAQRLIIAVPYEGEKPETVYGHEQLFNRAKLETVGNWCLQHLNGLGNISVEDCAGGLLLVERYSS